MCHYLIAVGGTGAKIAEAVVHLAAAGLLPSPCQLKILFVDADEGNGNVRRAIQTAKVYRDCQTSFQTTVEPFKNELTLLAGDVQPWCPVGANGKQLNTMFGYVNLPRAEQHLMECLFSDDERKLDLTEGFRARPAIGSATWARELDWRNSPGFSRLPASIDKEGQAAPVKVMFAGSIFGGTGASGVPNLGRLLYERFSPQGSNQNLEIGLSLALPYFTFEDGPDTDQGIMADPGEFLINTKEALRYYNDRQYLKFCKAIYLVGDQAAARMLTTAPGREKQRNEPHYTELLAALGIAHFFHAPSNGAAGTVPAPAARDGGRLFLCARKELHRLTWSDLPLGDGGDNNSKLDWGTKLRRLARFAVVMRHCFAPTMKDVRARKGRSSSRAPWYVDLLQKNNDFNDAEEAKLTQCEAYCDALLEWLMYVLRPKTPGVEFDVQLLNWKAFAKPQGEGLSLMGKSEFDPADLSGLFLGEEAQTENASLEGIWKRVCDTRLPAPVPKGVGRAIQAIYNECWR